jgi:SprT protein
MSNYLQILSKYISKEGVDLIFLFFNRYPFHLKILNPRKTRLGDYRYYSEERYHQITINNDLGKDAFLFTLIHEIAHQHVQIKFGNRVEPHGIEWKETYRELLLLALEKDCFENASLIVESLDNIKSSSVYNKDIFRALYTDPSEDEVFLDSIIKGKDFIFNAVIFTKIEKRRSRTLCLNTEDNRQYLISNNALVMLIED